MLKLKSRGFTLVELLVAITIVSIMASIGIVAYGGVQRSSRDAKRRGDIDNLATAIGLYYAANKSLPPGTAGICSTYQGGTDWPADFKAAMVPYLSTVNVDPKNDQTLSRVYCFAGSMWCASGTSCSGYQRPNVWTYLEGCTTNKQTGDGFDLFGYGCPHYMRVIDTP